MYAVNDGPERGASETVLRTENVSKSFGGVQALSDVSVSIPAGAVVAVVGPNGSGKTTFIRTVVGDLRPTAGSITYTGPDTERPVGYLPQEPPFRPGFSAAETLAFYSSLVEGREPDRLLERVGLAAAADRNVEDLSGGMRQLLGIAQATIGEPPLVVLDEPASGLDPMMSERVFETAAEIADSSRTVVLSSHDLSLVETTADAVVILHRGTVAAMGSQSALREQYGADSLRGVLTEITGDSRVVTVMGDSR